MKKLKRVLPILALVTAAGCGVKKQTPQQAPKPVKTTVKKQTPKKTRRSWWRKRKPEPVKVQPQPISPQAERDQKISTLCKQFVDLDNKQVNWSGFCEKMQGYIKDDPELAEVCDVLGRIKESTSATSACWKLKPHLKKLPQVVYDEFEKFSVSELLSLVSTRMKQDVIEEQPQQPIAAETTEKAASATTDTKKQN